MIRIIKRVVSGATTVVLVVALLALGVFAFAILSGLKPAVVKTGSMRPMLDRGTLILVKPTLAEDLRVGQVITFTHPSNASKGLVTHRIQKIKRTKGKLVFTTKGDANPVADPWSLTLTKDAGLLKKHLPYVGHLGFLVRTKLGYIILLGLPVLILAGIALRKIWTSPDPEPEATSMGDTHA